MHIPIASIIAWMFLISGLYFFVRVIYSIHYKNNR
jgi:hypothetical protein